MCVPVVEFTAAETYAEALRRAVAAWRVDPGYWDVWGRYHEASPEALRKILESLGVAAATLEELNRALEERLLGEWRRLVPPAIVTGPENVEVPLRLPASMEAELIEFEIALEGGERRIIERAAAELPIVRRAHLDGQWFLERSAALGRLPLGYHEIRVVVRGAGQAPASARLRCIVAPERAWLPEALAQGERRAGLSVSLYGLRSERNWGCGDFTDLERLALWVAGRLGGAFILLNPLHAIHNRQPFNTSPYLPNSIFYRNFIYLDVERIEEFAGSSWARALRASPRIEAEIRALRQAPYVEYERVARLKLTFLRLAFRRFLRELAEASPRAAEFRRFVEAEGELLERYAVYCALDERMRRRDPSVWTWRQWPAELQDPDSEAVRQFAARHWRNVLFHKYVQWQIARQLERVQESAQAAGMSIGLMHDLALATDQFGSDLWAYRKFFVSGCRVGAPPDDFSPAGQDWAFPPPDAERHYQDGYRLFREMIRRAGRGGGALRIDHVMRFFRLYWIPEGSPPAQGTYVRDRHEDLLGILALESVRSRLLVVGEDLGTVEPEVRQALARFGILGYRVFYFEKNAHGDFLRPEEYPRQALVSSTTHDLPTLAGFWTGRDIEARRQAGILASEDSYRDASRQRRIEKQKILDLVRALKLVPAHVPPQADEIAELSEELHLAILGLLAMTPCLLLGINQEDLTRDPEQQNLPGTTAQYPNWRHKMRYSLEELEGSPGVAAFVAELRARLRAAGRIDVGLGVRGSGEALKH